MTWLVAHWRLKLLAVLLAVVLLGAVAFSENPVTVQSRTVPITYEGLPDNLILIAPTTTATFNVLGLSQTLHQLGPGSVTATVDASKLTHTSGKAPSEETVNVVPHVLATGVTAQTDHIPISVYVDDRTTTQIPIAVKSPNVGEGWQITKSQVLDASGNRAHETVTGAASQLNGLKAFAEVDSPIENDVIDSPGAKVRFLDASNRELKWPPATLPVTTSDPDLVTVHIEAKRLDQSRQVFVRVSTTGSPASGYEVTSISVTPDLVVLTGAANIVSQYTFVNLPNIDLTGLNSNRLYRLPVNVPSGVTADFSRVNVTITVQPIPNATPKPTPSPSPSPGG